MAKMNSRMMPLGSIAPGFLLPDPDGNYHSLTDAQDAAATLVMFICNHCPFVQHIRGTLGPMCNDYLQRGVAVFAIGSNDIDAFPDDSPKMMKREIVTQGYRFPYLYDEDQAVAKKYEAACTPDFFLFDGDRKLVYRGQFDASRPDNAIPVDGNELRAAIDAVLDGSTVDEKQIPSVGCNIKWKSGNAPDWFA